MPKSLVTGGAGFIGSHLTTALLDRGHDVVVLDDLSGGFLENIGARARSVEGSVTDHSLIDRLFAEEQFQYVYHLAAYAAEGVSDFIKRYNYTNNVVGSVNLINASVNTGVKCFVFTSSIAIYGTGQVPMSEELIPQPEDSYGISKFAVERELVVTHEMFGLDYVIFRPHHVYGEGQNIGDKYRNVIGIFMNQIMRGEPLSIFGDGEQSQAFSHVSDVVPAIADAPATPTALCQTFNVGADVPYTINHLVEVVCSAMEAPRHEIVHHEARNEVKDAFADHAKVRQVFGVSSATDLAAGVRRMAAWAKASGPRQTAKFVNIEIARNLPASWAVE